MSSKRKMSTRKLTVTGMMIAVTVILSYTPLGIIPLQPVSATRVHIPTIIIALLEGPLVGGIVGASFGISSMLQAITRPTSIFSPCFMNPIVSVLPRICIGVVAAYSYKGLMTVTKNNTISAIIASAVGSLTNTLGAMGLIYFIYVESMTERIGTAAGPVIWGVITTYGIVEMLAAVVICTAVVLALQKAVYRSKMA